MMSTVLSLISAAPLTLIPNQVQPSFKRHSAKYGIYHKFDRNITASKLKFIWNKYTNYDKITVTTNTNYSKFCSI